MLDKVDSGAESIHVEKPLDAQHQKTVPEAVVTEAVRKRILRRIDLRVVPILTVLYLLSFLDRGSIGNANILGLSEDLGLQPSQYNWCLTIFFFPYSFLEPICNLLLVRFKPSRWLPSIMVLWGIATTLTGIVQGYSSLLAARFFLGVTEAGLFPGIAFYMSLWYPRDNAQLRLSIVFAAASMAGAFSGLLAYLIDKMDGVGNLEGWRWIFILEGLLTFIVAVAAYGLVQDEPATCKFLSEDDKRVLLALIHNITADHNATVENAPATTLGNEGNAGRWTHVIAALKDWQTIFHCINYWGMAVAVYALSLFLPQIINGLGYTAQIAQLLTIPVYAAATITTVVMGYFADKTGGRSIYILVCYVVVFIGFLMAVAPSAFIPGLTYAGCFIAACGIYPSLPGLLALASNNYAPNTKRAVGMAIQIGFGTMGGAAASNFYRKSDAPRYRLGHGLVLAFVSLGLIMVTIYYVICRRVNKRRDSQGPEAQILTQEDLATKGDKALGFRYKL
ncbi:hypothetical protein FSARC_4555 [Fusarium sarcochroum]|uniref:Major facilitator superfamily (MFS) profile domain-containing protein n=1 Tax=Fusarium sarcochroum TaxID=1208366 RepID=A0A8H4U1I6_9HYPO|nr:hypothetical protein FSARC_4555 [Fusarium sarcochroum]